MPFIAAGSTTASRQALIDANPSGTSFCLQTGVHFASGDGVPKSGDIFTGQYGAIIEGSGWLTGDLDASPFRAVNTGVVDVQIRNLEIRNCPSYAINAYLTSSGWIVDHCDLHHNRYGLSLGKYAIASNNRIMYNVGDTSNPNAAYRGGGYAFNSSIGLQFLHNEVAFNGVEQKFIYGTMNEFSRNYTIKGNYVHDNLGDGLWVDGDGDGTILEENICEDNGRTGITTEKCKNIIVRNNTVRRNQSGIYNSESRECTYSTNTLQDNDIGFDIFLDCSDIGTTLPFLPWQIDLINCSWTGNVVRVPIGGGKYGTAFSVLAPGTCKAPYVGMTKNLVFDQNTYIVPTLVGAFWFWDGNKTWAQWQALPQDPNGNQSLT